MLERRGIQPAAAVSGREACRGQPPLPPPGTGHVWFSSVQCLLLTPAYPASVAGAILLNNRCSVEVLDFFFSPQFQKMAGFPGCKALEQIIILLSHNDAVCMFLPGQRHSISGDGPVVYRRWVNAENISLALSFQLLKQELSCASMSLSGSCSFCRDITKNKLLARVFA